MDELILSLLLVSASAAVTALIILAVRGVMSTRIQPFVRSFMWVLLFVRLLLPWGFGNALGLIPSGGTAASVQATDSNSTDVTAAGPYASQQPGTAQPAQPGLSQLVPDVVSTAHQPDAIYSPAAPFRLSWEIVWAGGALIVGVYFLGFHLTFIRRLRRFRACDEPKYVSLLDVCRREAGIKRPVKLVWTPEGGPAAYGVFRPFILLPDRFRSLNDEEQRPVLAHELTHIKYLHPLALVMAQLTLTVHWFNPVLWLAAAAFSADLEMICDSRTVRRLSIGEREYAQTIIAISTAGGKKIPALGAVQSRRRLVRRFRVLLVQKKPWVSVLCAILAAVLICAGCALIAPGVSTPPASPPASQPSPSSKTSQPDAMPSTPADSALPRTIEENFVIVQDYANNETSAAMLEPFAQALDARLAVSEDVQGLVALSGPQQFLLNAAIRFEQGALLCGRFLQDGEIYSELYYLENGAITACTTWSDCWSMNYTLFKNHTIAYGQSLGWDNGVVMLDHVTAEFADGQTASQSFANIPFVSDKDGWQDGSVITDGYILVADGETWVQDIAFYNQDGTVYTSWSTDQLRGMFYSTSVYVWRDEPNEIWTVYHYAQMPSVTGRTAAESSAPAVSVFTFAEETEDMQEAYLQRFLLNDTDGIECLWRNNNGYYWRREIGSMADIDIQGLSDDDEIIWVALDRDDGSSPPDYAALCSAEPPTKSGNYCLIIRLGGDAALEHQSVYFTLFVRLT